MLINTNLIERFRRYLIREEKSRATVEKYIRDVRAFFDSVRGGAKRDFIDVDKGAVIAYKEKLQRNYKLTGINSMLSSLNSFFAYLNHPELRVKTFKIQRRVFAAKERELTRSEYERLLKAAGEGTRLCCIIMTLAATGMRVSELRFITVDAISRTYAEVDCKGKTRRVMLPKELCRRLKRYARKAGVERGSIFVTKSGRPVTRMNIWSSMKKLCQKARVDSRKVFPHNLRHLFAVTFYTASKDIVKLADVLGHSNINTTRIYTIENGDKHRKFLDKLKLVI